MRERPSPGYLADHCGRKPGSTSGSPFGEEHRVFKVCGKFFAVLHVKESPVRITSYDIVSEGLRKSDREALKGGL